MSTLRLCLERNVSQFVRTSRGVEEKTFDEIFVLLGTTPAEKEIPKRAGMQWDGQSRYWWTASEANARALAQYAHNGLRERWGMEAVEETSSKPVGAVEQLAGAIVGTPQQEAFWHEIEHGTTHLVLKAGAGCGKTFSIIQAGCRARARRIGYTSFNSHICKELDEKLKELKERAPQGATVASLHSLGFSAVRRNNPRVRLDKHKVTGLVKELLPDSARSVQFIGTVAKIVSLCKSYLSDGRDRALLQSIADRHDIDLSPPASDMDRELYKKLIFSTVPRIMARCAQALDEAAPSIDYDDMVWLPVKLGLALETFDLLFVDEAQDMNLCQQRLAFMACPRGRIVIVGDPKQAIYAFRGADTRSMARMTEQLEQSERGVKTLPLMFTRRCPKLHVQLAQALVPELEAMPEAPDGEVLNISESKIARLAQPEEMVICRTNAPLVRVAYELIRAGKKPLMKGRDIGASIRELLKKLDADTMPQLAKALDEYFQAEANRLVAAGKDDALIRLEDRVQTLEVLMEGCSTIEQLEDRMAEIFEAKDDGEAVILSSVHSCKGLEAPTVYILRPELMPHPKARRAEDLEQEYNIRYVALTRSKNRLVFAYEVWIEKDRPEAPDAECEPQDGSDTPATVGKENDVENGSYAQTTLFDEPTSIPTDDLREDDGLREYCQISVDIPARVLNPTPYWDQVESDGLPLDGLDTEDALPAVPTNWRDDVRGLLRQAYERAPFDAVELLAAIETALQEVK